MAARPLAQITPLEATASNINQDLLRGAGQITAEIYGEDTPANRRRLYHEQGRWPIFRLADDGIMYALRSRIRSLLEAKSMEREAQIAASAAFAGAEVREQPKQRSRDCRTRGQGLSRRVRASREASATS